MFKNKKKSGESTSNEDAFVGMAEGGSSLTEHKDNKFAKRATPKKITDENADELFMFRCPCGHTHFRHAGYIEIMMPYMMGNREDGVQKESCQVMICIKCKRAYIWVNSQMYDVTDMIDFDAWDKTENNVHRITGPGGQC